MGKGGSYEPPFLVILFFAQRVSFLCLRYAILKGMEDSTLKSRSFIAIIILVTLVALSAAIPVSWLGLKPQIGNSQYKIDVSSIKPKKDILTDSNGDGKITWKEVIDETLPMDEQTKANLKNEKVDPAAMAALNDPNNLTASK